MSKKLKSLRALQGKTQTDMAKLLNVGLKTYCLKENGKIEFSLSEAKKISEIFNLSIEEIFFDE